MAECFIGIGSNLGDKKANIRKAIELLGEKCNVLKVSSLYETEPVGFKEQDWFLNCVVKIDTGLKPHDLLLFLQSIERKLKRAGAVKNGPRTIDLDILFYGDLIIDEKDLVIPHPKLHERLFVLRPLCEISADLVHPVLKRNVKELVESLRSGERVELYASD